jgi:hypothetical protein
MCENLYKIEMNEKSLQYSTLNRNVFLFKQVEQTLRFVMNLSV